MADPELDSGSRASSANGQERKAVPSPEKREAGADAVAAERPAKSRPELPWIVAGVVVLAVALLIVVTGVGIGAWVYFSNRSFDVAAPKEPVPGSAEVDFALWQQQLERLAQPGAAAAPLPPVAASAQGWWDRNWVLLPQELIRVALERRLPPGMKVTALQIVGFETLGGCGVRAVYRVGLVSPGKLVLVPSGPFVPPQDLSAQAQKWMMYAIHAPYLPAGTAYQLDRAVVLLHPGQAVEMDWTVRRAARVDGKWRVLESDPIVYQRNAEFERRLRLAPGGAKHLRTEAELAAARAMSAAAVEEIKATAADVASRAAVFRRDALAKVPPAARDTGGRGGSGTPTKTGLGVLGGAALGGGIGAAAGELEGAAIGAGVGALLGGIIGYNAGRADEKRAVQQKNAAHQQAVRAANSRAAAYQAQITREAEQVLKVRAESHNARLDASGGF